MLNKIIVPPFKMRQFKLSFGAFLFLIHSMTMAQDKMEESLELSLEDLMNINVTTATKSVKKTDLIPAAIEVITAEQIQQRGYTTLDDVINDLVDNNSDRSNWGIGEPLNQNSGFGFRFDCDQNILLLFNGQRLNAFLPGNRFGGEEYLLAGIDRIEIIRGPGSAIYGPNAFTLVANIITKTSSDEQSELFTSLEGSPTSIGTTFNSGLKTQLGKNTFLSAFFRFGKEEGQLLKVENSVFGNYELRDGVNHAIDGEVFLKSGNWNIYGKFSDQSRNTFTGFNSVNFVEMDKLALKAFAYSLSSDYTVKVNEKLEIKASGGWHMDNWSETALIPLYKLNAQGDGLMYGTDGNPVLDTLAIYRDGVGQIIETSFFIDGQSADTQTLDGEIQLTYKYTKHNNIIVGLNVINDRILDASRPTELTLDPLGFTPFTILKSPNNNWLFDLDASRTTLGVYGQIDYDLKDIVFFNIGARLDNFSGTGVLKEQKYTEINPKIGVVVQGGKFGNFKINYGSATRIPNGFETLSSVAILGDPTNTPERIKVLQGQWIKNWNSNLRTEVGYFNTTIENRLVTDAAISELMLAQGFVGQFINLPDKTQSSSGIDAKINFRIKRVEVLYNLTQFISTDDGDGNPLPYQPKFMSNANINLPVKSFNFNFGFNYRGEYSRPESDFRKPVSSRFVTNTRVSYKVKTSSWSFFVDVKNLFDTQYNYPASSFAFYNHFPARGVQASIGLAFKTTGL